MVFEKASLENENHLYLALLRLRHSVLQRIEWLAAKSRLYYMLNSLKFMSIKNLAQRLKFGCRF
jgi:hypothetical protein